MPHLPPLPRDAVPEFAALFEHYENTRGFIPNSILTMSRRPGIARAFMQLNQAEQEDFDELAKHFDEGQIVERVASVALFGYLNRWNDSMATELEDHPSKVAQRTIGDNGWQPGKHG